MKIMEVKKFTRRGAWWYTPVDNFALFKHCSGGAIAVAGHIFENDVKPMLLIHGIEEVNIV